MNFSKVGRGSGKVTLSLTHFLFVLCFEYFSRSIKVATSNIDFNFHSKCGHLKITQLACADDLMFFARGDIISVGILMECLSSFGDCSGLRANINKSSLITVGITRLDLEEIKCLTNIPPGTMSFGYLGVLFAVRRLKVNLFAPCLDKIGLAHPSLIQAWPS